MSIGTAYTRAVSPRLAECELSHRPSQPIDIARAIAQHRAYEDALAEAGLTVVRLPPLDDFADGVFVEDTALLLGEHAIITRPGAASRAAEADSTASALAGAFTIHRLSGGTLDGGDVLRIGKTLYVGSSGRTSREGIAALADAAGPLGYAVVPVEVTGCLHLKTAATFAGHDSAGNPVLVYHPPFVSPAPFAGVEPVAVDEPDAANAVRAGGKLLVSGEGPRSAEMLARRGFDLVPLDVGELHKAEAGLTCMSLIAERPDPR
jgi:dimethylargininase